MLEPEMEHRSLDVLAGEPLGEPPSRRSMRNTGHRLAALAAVLSLCAATIFVGMQGGDANALLSWSNFADDGSGVLGGQQHGVSMIIHSCDADDPACTFQTSRQGYSKGQWVSNLNSKNERRMEVHVRSDLRQGSSYEDDIGEGPLAGMHKTDEKGVFKEWTPRPERFREREYSRVKVGVEDEDGMDSWEYWRKAHPDRKGHGNIALQPYKLPTTDESMVFRGPLNQPREMAPIDQNYDFTTINTPIADSSKQARVAQSGIEQGRETKPADAVPSPIVRDGVEYVPVHRDWATRDSAAASAQFRLDAGKDESLLKALHEVVDVMHSSESEYTALKRQLNVLEASRQEVEKKAATSRHRLQNFASEETRIIGAIADSGTESEVQEEPSAEEGAIVGDSASFETPADTDAIKGSQEGGGVEVEPGAAEDVPTDEEAPVEEASQPADSAATEEVQPEDEIPSNEAPRQVLEAGKFKGEFWQIPEAAIENLDRIPDMLTLGEPTSTREADVIDLDSAAFERMGWADHFAAHWTGEIEINAGGTYTFFDISDDGSKVFVNGMLVVDNDGLHGPEEEKSGAIDLEKGRYPFTVDFFEKDGGANLHIKYSGPDTDGEPVLLQAAPIEVDAPVVSDGAEDSSGTLPQSSGEKSEEVEEDVDSAIGGALGNVANIFEGVPRPTVDDSK